MDNGPNNANNNSQEYNNENGLGEIGYEIYNAMVNPVEMSQEQREYFLNHREIVIPVFETLLIAVIQEVEEAHHPNLVVMFYKYLENLISLEEEVALIELLFNMGRLPTPPAAE